MSNYGIPKFSLYQLLISITMYFNLHILMVFIKECQYEMSHKSGNEKM